MQKLYISQNEKLSFDMNAEQLQFVKFLFPLMQQRMDFCWEQITGILLYHCWESYSFQMLWLIHGWAMHKEEIGNKIYLIWLFSPISQIIFPNRDDIWQDKKCLLGKLNLVFPSKSQIYLQFEITDKDSAEWDFRSFIATRRRMHDELCKLGNWRSGMNLIISNYCSNLIWHKTWFNLDMEHFSKDIFNFWKPLPHVCASQMHFAIDLFWLCWIQCVAIREAID